MTSVLYIGGTGEISQACVEASLRLGHEVSVLNRGTQKAKIPAGVEHIVGDLSSNNPYSALGVRVFDVVCQFLAYDVETVSRDVETFRGRCGQYLFISTASAYEKPCKDYYITEATPLSNPFWEYSRKKAACEAFLRPQALAQQHPELPVTIVRPSHTYRTRLPGTVIDGDHQAWRMLQGKPVIVHGDGQSLWTLTYASDFAAAFSKLCGNAGALGQTFHITNSKAYTWDVIIDQVGSVLGKVPEVVHVASDTLVNYQPAWRGTLLGDKSNSVLFDNSKIKETVGEWQCEISLTRGIELAGAFAHERLGNNYRPDPNIDALIDRIVREQST